MANITSISAYPVSLPSLYEQSPLSISAYPVILFEANLIDTFVAEITRKYGLEVHNAAGDLLMILENAHNISYVQSINSPYILSFALPADDPKASSVILANEIWLRNYRTGAVVRRFLLGWKRDIR